MDKPGEPKDVQALGKICSEVDDSQVKITLSSHCIKAQAFLVDKLRKQSERQKEICNFVSSSNVKLQTEIKNAEGEVNSLLVAQETLRSANVELKKELLLTKESKKKIAERIYTGKIKYHEMWEQSRQRYESIPHVQKWLETTQQTENIQKAIQKFEKETEVLVKEYETKKREVKNLDKQRIIAFAEFIVNEMPVFMKTIEDKTKDIDDLSKKLQELKDNRADEMNEIQTGSNTSNPLNYEEQKQISIFDESWPSLKESMTDINSVMMPKLRYSNMDLDILSYNLVQIKRDNNEEINKLKRTDSTLSVSHINKIPCLETKDFEQYASSYFTDSKKYNVSQDVGDKSNDYSKRKLVNILEDIKINKNDVYNIMATVNPKKMQSVDVITAPETSRENAAIGHSKKDIEPIQSEEIEEITTDDKLVENLIVPPTQFLDLSQTQNSQNCKHQHIEESEAAGTSSKESAVQKKVSFNLTNSGNMETNEIDMQRVDETDINDTINSQLDVSSVSDETYSRLKDMILKKHNFDLSPQFVYGKNNILQRTEDQIVTSKFFKQTTKVVDDVDKVEDLIEERPTQNEIAEDAKEVSDTTEINKDGTTENKMEVEELTSLKVLANQEQITANAVSGFLFNHGAQGIPDSLNVSISTTGYDEGDSEFPHCIDSSLLLSPKADLPDLMNDGNPEVLSQDVPNFLSGLRKTGLSFFGGMSSGSIVHSEGGQATGNKFSFSFGNDEKKSRGGLFSMFLQK